MKRKVRIFPVVLPILLVIGLFTAAAVSFYQTKQTEVSHSDLGEKYLVSMNYSDAAAEFAAALSENPANVAARTGLAQAYMAMGETDMVADVLQPLTDDHDPEAYRMLIKIEEEKGNIREALHRAQELVDMTDADEDYDLRDRIFRQVALLSRSYAAGTDHKLVIRDGVLYAMGSNLLGQLGREALLATTQTETTFVPVTFPATPARVYCAGRTSYVVDTENNLWAAGENRWGQMGTGSMTLTGDAGWTKIVDSCDVATVTGSVGRTYVLKLDGSLWYAGEGGIAQLTRITDLSKVMDLQGDSYLTAALTTDGKLYSYKPNGRWICAAQNVKAFTLCQGVLYWVTKDNQVCTNSYYFTCPENWEQGKRGPIPNFTVMHLAADPYGLLLQGTDGILRRLYYGDVMTVDTLSAVNFYATAEYIILETADGVMRWDWESETPGMIPQ